MRKKRKPDRIDFEGKPRMNPKGRMNVQHPTSNIQRRSGDLPPSFSLCSLLRRTSRFPFRGNFLVSLRWTLGVGQAAALSRIHLVSTLGPFHMQGLSVKTKRSRRSVESKCDRLNTETTCQLLIRTVQYDCNGIANFLPQPDTRNSRRRNP